MFFPHRPFSTQRLDQLQGFRRSIEFFQLLPAADDEITAQGVVAGELHHLGGHLQRLLGIEVERGISGHLGQGIGIGREHGQADGHRLQNRDAESLMQ